MNNNTEQLIRELATKLGTTTEHLWGVLIHQAAISGVVNLFTCAAWIAFSVWSFKFIQRKRGDWTDEGIATGFVIWGIGVFIIVLTIGCNLEQIASSFLNPEYWALKQVVH